MVKVSTEELRRLASAKLDEIRSRQAAGKKVHRDEVDEGFLLTATDPKGTMTYSPSITLLLTRKGIVKSRSEAKRLIAEGAIEVIHEDGSTKTLSRDKASVKAGDRIKVGKRRWVKIVDADAEQ
ncbi:MAG: hypothetical protein E3J81_06285 [Dehalococcoidia bacterium]|nr:MAG: hypothetical protein E3J81_06285 [Dehalococcoidia bacterium]